MKTLRTTLLIILLSLFLMVIPASAQTPVTFQALEVDLWPEYDQLSMLVIYRIRLSSDVSLPVDLTIRIPTSAGDPSAVAVRQADGALLNTTYTRQVTGEWSNVTVTATLPEIQIEYYDPELTTGDDLRQYTYTWNGEYPVEDFVIQVQKPFSAVNLQVIPEGMGQTGQGSDGLTYFTADVEEVPQGTPVEFTISYIKETNDLTVEHLNVESTGPINQEPRTQINLVQTLPWILGTVGVMLIAGGLIWSIIINRRPAQETIARRRRRAASHSDPTVVAETGDSLAIYCHQCGKRANPGDRFCRACGSRLRVE